MYPYWHVVMCESAQCSPVSCILPSYTTRYSIVRSPSSRWQYSQYI